MGKRKKKKTIPIRLNIIFFAVFLLFSALILRLGFVQIVYGEDYKRELEKTEDVTVNTSVPRGKIYDTTGKIIVDNKAKNAITYTNTGVKQEEMLKTAKLLAKYIKKDTKKVTERDKQDYWIIKNPKEAEEKVSAAEKKELQKKYTDEDEYNQQVYKLQLKRITEKELNTLTQSDLEVIAVYREFSSGYKLTPQMVKNEDVTDEELAVVSEHLESLPGVETTTDWDRMYKFKDTLKSVLGNVSSSEKGLPAEKLEYYESRGYSRNDRVGTSYLELQYEDVLKGQKEKVRNKTDKSGNITSTEVIAEGQRGNDLVLSVDMELQLKVEKIIEEELRRAKQSAGTSLLDRAYVVLMDPDTGEVLSMAGKRLEKNSETGKTEMTDDALGNITTTYNVGSVVKGATVLAGYKTGAISPGTVQSDTGLKIAGTPLKKSWTYMGDINDLTALQRSSNVYMFRTAIKIAGGTYAYNQPLDLNTSAFTTMRNYYAQFGLGVRTGIDLPNEQTGFKGASLKPGFLLDLAIGQYDTYSNMQLAQYVSTIANGGKRMEPHIVKEIREPVSDENELGPIVETIKPKVLNTIDAKQSWIERVQLGFKMVAQTPKGTVYSALGGKSYSPAAKSGTAQAFYDGPARSNYDEPPEVMNLSLISYAPSDNPEVAMAVLVPWAYQGSVDNGINKNIGERVLDAYFDLKKERQSKDKD